jgi:predicted ATPase
MSELRLEICLNPLALPTSASLYGRTDSVPKEAGDVCRFKFADFGERVCRAVDRPDEQALGPDYISLASTFRLFLIDEVLVLLLNHRHGVSRLILLVDALCTRPYSCKLTEDESTCRLYIHAEASPQTMPCAHNSCAHNSRI